MLMTSMRPTAWKNTPGTVEQCAPNTATRYHRFDMLNYVLKLDGKVIMHSPDPKVLMRSAAQLPRILAHRVIVTQEKPGEIKNP